MSVAGLLASAAFGPALAASAHTENDQARSDETVMLRTGALPPAIIVQGERPVEEAEVREAIRDIAMRGRNLRRPMTQFQAPLCVTVGGLGQTFNNSVADRIRANTSEASFEVAKAGCETNALVIVVKNPNRLIERLREEKPNLFTANVNRKIKSAQRRGDVAIGWSVSRINGKDGNPAGDAGAVAGAAGTALFDNASGNVPTTTSLGTSKYTISYSQERVFSVLVFDVERMTGVHLDQIADYSTMRLLASPQPTINLEEGTQADSILTLFDLGPYDAPQRMTQIDRAFLRGLYAMRPNDPSNRLDGFILSAYEDIREEDCAKRAGRSCTANP